MLIPERKRQSTREKRDAWNGVIGHCAMDEMWLSGWTVSSIVSSTYSYSCSEHNNMQRISLESYCFAFIWVGIWCIMAVFTSGFLLALFQCESVVRAVLEMYLNICAQFNKKAFYRSVRQILPALRYCRLSLSLLF